MDQKLEFIYIDNYKYIFYSSILIFSLFHLNKYIIDIHKLYIYPILILPQIVNGIIWGYTRVRFGIKWSIIQHVIFNLVINLPLMLFNK